MIVRAPWVSAPSSRAGGRTSAEDAARRPATSRSGNGERDISTVRSTTPDDDVPFEVSLAVSPEPGCVVASGTGELDAAGEHVRVVATSRIVTGPLGLTGLLDRLDVTGMPTPGPDGDGGPPRRARPADPQAMHGATASATMGGGGDTAGQEENT